MSAQQETFSADEMRVEMSRFRALLGTRSFWELPSEKRQLAVGGLLHVYLRLTDISETVESQLAALLDEYARRESLMSAGGFAGL